MKVKTTKKQIKLLKKFDKDTEEVEQEQKNEEPTKKSKNNIKNLYIFLLERTLQESISSILNTNIEKSSSEVNIKMLKSGGGGVEKRRWREGVEKRKFQYYI